MSLHIAHFKQLHQVNGVNAPVPQMPPTASEVLAVGASSVQGAVFADSTMVRLYADEACRIEVGPTPTATASSMPLAAGAEFWCGVRSTHRIAVIGA